MRRLGQLAAKLFDEPRLADAGLAGDQDKLALARESALRAARKDGEVVFATDKRGEEPGAPLAPAAADPHDPIELHWRGGTLELMGALVLDDEQSGDLPLDGRCDQHRSRLGGGLSAGGDVGRFPEHFARGVDDHLAAFDADANGKLWSAGRHVSAVHLGHRLLDAQGGPNGSFRVILLRLRIAEASHEPIAELLEHPPAKRRHRLRGLIEIAVDEIAPVLDVRSSRELGRADEVAEHDGDRAPFGRI